MSKGIYSNLTVEGEFELNGELLRMGIPHTIGDLFHDNTLCPERAPELLELFRRPLPFNVRTALAQVVFARKLNLRQKREAFGVLMELIKENSGKYNGLAMLVWNELPNNVDPTKVHELGEMALDSKYGPLRSGFLIALRKIRNATAVGYLLRAARDPLTAALALDQLARLRVPGLPQMCEQALTLPGVIRQDFIRKIRAKAQRHYDVAN